MTKQKETIFLIDSLGKRDKNSQPIDFFSAASGRNKNHSVFFSKNGLTETFFTSDSKLYITPEEYRNINAGNRVVRITGRLDSLNSRGFERSRIYAIGTEDMVYLQIRRRYSSIRNYFADLISGATQGVSVARMWNMSLVGAVIFGMITMTMIYRYLGQSAAASIKDSASKEQGLVLGAEDNADFESGLDADAVEKLLRDYQSEKSKDLENEIMDMVKGYPIEEMVPEIAKRDRIVAAFLIGIAKKESNWGKRVPVLNGQDCYNYWGYRGIRDKMGTGGHTCFNSPKDAVDTVSKRIDFLVSNKKLNTPDKLVIWKCGYDCNATGGQAAANKWISDVGLYFNKLNQSEE